MRELKKMHTFCGETAKIKVKDENTLKWKRTKRRKKTMA